MTHRHEPRPVAAFDLDRTLIFSAAAAGDPAGLPPLTTVEHADGRPLSKMTETAWSMLGNLMEVAEVVPVTTRSVKQYQRIRFPTPPRYAICANGGVLLVDGDRDRDWDQWVRGTVAMAAPLDRVRALMDEVADRDWVRKVRSVEDLFCYVVANHRKDVPGKWLRTFTETVTSWGWNVSVQGRKVYAVPDGLCKASGLMRLRSILEDHHDTDVPVYSTGDSLLDAPMLEAADEAIRPAHGELHDTGWTATGVTVTDASGAVAGEQIVEWMTDRVTDR